MVSNAYLEQLNRTRQGQILGKSASLLATPAPAPTTTPTTTPKPTSAPTTGNPNITDQQIRDFMATARNDQDVYNAAQQHGISSAQLANALKGTQWEANYTQQNIDNYIAAQTPTSGNPNITDQQIRDFMATAQNDQDVYNAAAQHGISSEQLANALKGTQWEANYTQQNIDNYIAAQAAARTGNPNITDQQIRDFMATVQNDRDVYLAAQQYGISAEQLANALRGTQWEANYTKQNIDNYIAAQTSVPTPTPTPTPTPAPTPERQAEIIRDAAGQVSNVSTPERLADPATIAARNVSTPERLADPATIAARNVSTPERLADPATIAARNVEAQNVRYNPETDMVNINPETDLVEGRLNSILNNPNAPLLQRAQALAQMQSANRGLLNSSLSATAGTTAMIDTALQVATPDAQAYQQANLANAQAYQQARLQDARQALIASQSNAELGLRADVANADNLYRTGAFNIEQQSAADQFNSELGLRADMANVDNLYKTGTFNISQQSAADQFNAELGLRSDMANADNLYRTGTFNIEQQTAANQFNANAQNQAILQQQQNLQQQDRMRLENELRAQTLQLESRLKQDLNLTDFEYKRLLQKDQNVAGMLDNYNRGVQSILQDPNLSPEGKQNALDQLNYNTTSSFRVMGVADRLNLGEMLGAPSSQGGGSQAPPAGNVTDSTGRTHEAGKSIFTGGQIGETSSNGSVAAINTTISANVANDLRERYQIPDPENIIVPAASGISPTDTTVWLQGRPIDHTTAGQKGAYNFEGFHRPEYKTPEGFNVTAPDASMFPSVTMPMTIQQAVSQGLVAQFRYAPPDSMGQYVELIYDPNNVLGLRP